MRALPPPPPRCSARCCCRCAAPPTTAAALPATAVPHLPLPLPRLPPSLLRCPPTTTALPRPPPPSCPHCPTHAAAARLRCPTHAVAAAALTRVLRRHRRAALHGSVLPPARKLSPRSPHAMLPPPCCLACLSAAAVLPHIASRTWASVRPRCPALLVLPPARMRHPAAPMRGAAAALCRMPFCRRRAAPRTMPPSLGCSACPPPPHCPALLHAPPGPMLPPPSLLCWCNSTSSAVVGVMWCWGCMTAQRGVDSGMGTLRCGTARRREASGVSDAPCVRASQWAGNMNGRCRLGRGLGRCRCSRRRGACLRGRRVV